MVSSEKSNCSRFFGDETIRYFIKSNSSLTQCLPITVEIEV